MVNVYEWNYYSRAISFIMLSFLSLFVCSGSFDLLTVSLAYDFDNITVMMILLHFVVLSVNEEFYSFALKLFGEMFAFNFQPCDGSIVPDSTLGNDSTVTPEAQDELHSKKIWRIKLTIVSKSKIPPSNEKSHIKALKCQMQRGRNYCQ